MVTASASRFLLGVKKTFLRERILTVAVSFEHTKNHCSWGRHPETQTQVIRLGGNTVYLLSHLSGGKVLNIHV